MFRVLYEERLYGERGKKRDSLYNKALQNASARASRERERERERESAGNFFFFEERTNDFIWTTTTTCEERNFI